jgi:hypothetical protein
MKAEFNKTIQHLSGAVQGMYGECDCLDEAGIQTQATAIHGASLIEAGTTFLP